MCEEVRHPLSPAAEADIDELMRWFPDAASTRRWGGPFFRYPFSADTFAEDVHWPDMASWCLRESAGTMIAFGQFYERFGRINIARLVVHPKRRGQGLGRELLTALMRRAEQQLALPEFALFVYRDNHAAIRCYQECGFTIAEFPAGAPLRDETWYMTCGSRRTAAVQGD